MFDPSQFVNATVTSPMSTSVIVCPEGEWKAIVSDEGDLKEWFRLVEWKDKKNGEDRSSPAVRIPFKIIDQRAKDILSKPGQPFERDLYASMDSFLDLDSAGNPDVSEGKNVKLGQLRKALDQNNPGQTWGFQMLRGAGPVIVKVAQRSDEKDPNRKFADVVRVLKLS
jgi:hypothetical protein